jgi:hypothetical protein
MRIVRATRCPVAPRAPGWFPSRHAAREDVIMTKSAGDRAWRLRGSTAWRVSDTPVAPTDGRLEYSRCPPVAFRIGAPDGFWSAVESGSAASDERAGQNTEEGCESGRIGRSRKPLSLRAPWVQIPLPPLVRGTCSLGSMTPLTAQTSYTSTSEIAPPPSTSTNPRGPCPSLRCKRSAGWRNHRRSPPTAGHIAPRGCRVSIRS